MKNRMLKVKAQVFSYQTAFFGTMLLIAAAGALYIAYAVTNSTIVVADKSKEVVVMSKDEFATYQEVKATIAQKQEAVTKESLATLKVEGSK
jgi:hypothetical protein